jgi:hypothetical protein
MRPTMTVTAQDFNRARPPGRPTNVDSGAMHTDMLSANVALATLCGRSCGFLSPAETTPGGIE